MAAGRIADLGDKGRLNAASEETLQFLAAVVEHAEGGISGPREIPGDLEGSAHHLLQVEFGSQLTTGVNQAPQVRIGDRRAGGHDRNDARQ